VVDEPDTGLDGWIIALIVIGSVAVVGGAALTCYAVIRKKKNGNEAPTDEPEADTTASDCENEIIDEKTNENVSEANEEVTAEENEDNNSEE
jgi:hypothetical protein